jgi:GTP-dependent phosphoenolpyruvate carboxykinase
MKKVSAIEWLVEQLEGDDSIIARVIGLKKYNEIYKKAKEMEREQIKDAFVECWKANMPDGYECKLSAEEYYNETFKNK